MKAIELHEKNGTKWTPLSLTSFTGKPIRKEVWESMEGKEIVGKMTSEGAVIGYVVGTEELRTHYKEKTGKKVWSWTEAAALMSKTGSALLDDDANTILGELLKVFGEGCKVERVGYNFSC